LRWGLGNDLTPWLLTGDLSRVEVRRVEADTVDFFLLFAAIAAASAFLS